MQVKILNKSIINNKVVYDLNINYNDEFIRLSGISFDVEPDSDTLFQRCESIVQILSETLNYNEEIYIE